MRKDQPPDKQWETLVTDLRGSGCQEQGDWGNVDDLLIARFLAGECNDLERAAVECARQECPEVAECIALAGGALHEGDSSVLSTPAPASLPRAIKPARRWIWRAVAYGAAAACVLAVVGPGWLVMKRLNSLSAQIAALQAGSKDAEKVAPPVVTKEDVQSSQREPQELTSRVAKLDQPAHVVFTLPPLEPPLAPKPKETEGQSEAGVIEHAVQDHREPPYLEGVTPKGEVAGQPHTESPPAGQVATMAPARPSHAGDRQVTLFQPDVNRGLAETTFRQRPTLAPPEADMQQPTLRMDQSPARSHTSGGYEGTFRASATVRYQAPCGIIVCDAGDDWRPARDAGCGQVCTPTSYMCATSSIPAATVVGPCGATACCVQSGPQSSSVQPYTVARPVWQPCCAGVVPVTWPDRAPVGRQEIDYGGWRHAED